jgi:molybdopterin molybdotransferase
MTERASGETFTPDLVIAVDWSAASTPKPRRPSPDACWLAHATRGAAPTRPPEPEYFRTRAGCEARLAQLLDAHAGPALVGFDFPLGYPLADDGTPVLPVGRDLCSFLAERIEDDETNRNNRFDVAERLNAEIAETLGETHGPFWGCPPSRNGSSGLLTPTKRPVHGLPEFRAVERHVRAELRLPIQSPWKLFTTGSVGSQTLLGLPAVHRLLNRLGERGRLWPFEDLSDRPDAVVIAEIWPSLFRCDHVDHGMKDARQVVATRDALLLADDPLPAAPSPAAREGWITGLKSAH